MLTLRYLSASLILATTALNAATVVTTSERLTGTILSQDEKSLTLKLENRLEMKIPREKILQVFNEKGELVWQGKLPAEDSREKTQPLPLSERKPGFAHKSILLDFYIGSVLGGFHTEEKRLIDSLGIYVQYSDGSTQTASTKLLALGGGASYQWYSSLRWSSLISYIFRSTAQSVSAGDGDKYEKKDFASATITTRHALMFGKELHFYPGAEMSSWDIVGQLGYEYGSYKPLAAYNALTTQFPVLPRLSYPDVTIHGPTARLGTGYTLRGTNWQLRVMVFYQIAYSLASEQIWVAVPKNTVLHDFYGNISVGYGW